MLLFNFGGCSTIFSESALVIKSCPSINAGAYPLKVDFILLFIIDVHGDYLILAFEFS